MEGPLDSCAGRVPDIAEEMESLLDSCAGVFPDITEEIWEKNQKQVYEGPEPVAPIVCFDFSKVSCSAF